MDIGDAVLAKIWNIGGRGIDLSVKLRGFGKLYEGIIFSVNPHKIPRIIGKEGSMIKLIKDETGCNISVGQNGLIWIKGDSIDKEIFAKNAVLFVEENATKEGLTDEVTKWLGENKK
jgi:exosome complex component RRP4